MGGHNTTRTGDKMRRQQQAELTRLKWAYKAVADTQEITEHADGKISLWFSKVSSDYKTRYVNKFVIGVRGAVTVAQLQFDDRGYAT
jgi:SPX domain protein involved in polyphosphate accumulation